MRRTAEPSVLSDRACLKSEKSLYDRGDLVFFGGQIAVKRLSGQDRHVWSLLGSCHFKPAMNFIAVMLGKKQ